MFIWFFQMIHLFSCNTSIILYNYCFHTVYLFYCHVSLSDNSFFVMQFRWFFEMIHYFLFDSFMHMILLFTRCLSLIWYKKKGLDVAFLWIPGSFQTANREISTGIESRRSGKVEQCHEKKQQGRVRLARKYGTNDGETKFIKKSAGVKAVTAEEVIDCASCIEW